MENGDYWENELCWSVNTPRPAPGSSSPQSLLHLHPRVQLIWKIALGLLRTLLRFMITMRLGLCSNYKRPSYVINSTKSSYSGRGNKQRNLRGNAREHVHKHFCYSLLIFIYTGPNKYTDLHLESPRSVAGLCQHSNEPSVSIKDGYILDYLRDYQLLKNWCNLFFKSLHLLPKK